ncbi:MAG: 1-acyl-sn-glycerol-3-phosphate acyltransferase [Azoarcus sp.]|jgi:1-acyl-sn-glycerol-3-phosphate acyltransferase|nr:1-acyl-sn-glycerol-3-phosphate acyltransferase [Azoarcus sp.]
MTDPRAPRLSAAYATFCLWFGLGALGGICLFWSLVATCLHPFVPERRGARLGRRAINAGFRLYLWLLGLTGAFRFDIGDIDELANAGPLIIAPNHPCLLDAVMVIGRLPNIACVMKASLLKNLFLGGGARFARYIANDRPLHMVHAACAALAEGGQVLLFPEGTRTVSYPVNTILPSVALIAKKARVPVQTLVIETDSAYLSKGWPLFRRPPMPIHFRIRLGRRFEPPTDASRLAAELEACFAAELACARLVPPQFQPCPPTSS